MKYFVLGGPFCSDGSEFDFDPDESTRVGEAEKCGTCGNYYTMAAFLPPIKGRLVVGSEIFDLSKTSGGDVLLTEKCLTIFREHGVSGVINPQPVELLRIEGPLPLRAVGSVFIAQTSWGGEIDRAKSGLRTEETHVCGSCGFAGSVDGFDRVVIVESSWNDQDLFSIKGLPGILLATERLQSLCNEMQLKVCNLTPAEEFATPW